MEIVSFVAPPGYQHMPSWAASRMTSRCVEDRPGKGLVQKAASDLRLGVPPEFARRGSEDVQEDELVVPRLLKVARATQVVEAKVLRQLAVLLNILWNMKMQIEGMFFHIFSMAAQPLCPFSALLLCKSLGPTLARTGVNHLSFQLYQVSRPAVSGNHPAS